MSSNDFNISFNNFLQVISQKLNANEKDNMFNNWQIYKEKFQSKNYHLYNALSNNLSINNFQVLKMSEDKSKSHSNLFLIKLPNFCSFIFFAFGLEFFQNFIEKMENIDKVFSEEIENFILNYSAKIIKNNKEESQENFEKNLKLLKGVFISTEIKKIEKINIFLEFYKIIGKDKVFAENFDKLMKEILIEKFLNLEDEIFKFCNEDSSVKKIVRNIENFNFFSEKNLTIEEENVLKIVSFVFKENILIKDFEYSNGNYPKITLKSFNECKLKKKQKNFIRIFNENKKCQGIFLEISEEKNMLFYQKIFEFQIELENLKKESLKNFSKNMKYNSFQLENLVFINNFQNKQEIKNVTNIYLNDSKGNIHYLNKPQSNLTKNNFQSGQNY